MITLKIYVSPHNFWVLILGKETAQKGWNNGMETYHPLQLDSLLQTYCFHVLKKKKNQTFKPTPIPKIFGTLIEHWIQRGKKKNFFFNHKPIRVKIYFIIMGMCLKLIIKVGFSKA